MTHARMLLALRAAAVAALLALALMVWGILDPHPISLVIAMSVGQALGTASFLVFLGVVVVDLRRANVFSRWSMRPSRPTKP
jgi:hypothetical protein